jgi:hypothetical protein
MTSRCRRIALWELNELEARIAGVVRLAGPLPGPRDRQRTPGGG